jgi:RNA polymerase sigma-70 factor (ECF subfamily)
MLEGVNNDLDNMQRMKLLYEKFYARLYRYALTFMDYEEDASDIVGDVFMTVWEDWQREESTIIQPPASFLYTAVRNRCLDRLRHHQASKNYIQQMTAASNLTNDADVEDFEQRIVKLYDAIKQLPELDQQVLNCTYFKNLSYKQTADQLDITESMVHKHMLKVYKLLRGMLKIIIIGYQTFGLFVSWLK